MTNQYQDKEIEDRLIAEFLEIIKAGMSCVVKVNHEYHNTRCKIKYQN
jgi:hypothetical protein